MTLYEKLNTLIQEYRIARDSATAKALQTMQSEIVRKHVDKKKIALPFDASSDAVVISVMTSAIENAKECITALQKREGSEAQIAQLSKEIEIFSTFLPVMASDADVQNFIAQLKAEGLKNIGEFMPRLKAHFGNTVDLKKAKDWI